MQIFESRELSARAWPPRYLIFTIALAISRLCAWGDTRARWCGMPRPVTNPAAV